MQETFSPYPSDKFICVLQWQFAILDEQGDTVPAGKGDAVALRIGAPMSRKQEGYLKKFFAPYLNSNGPVPQIATAQEAVIVLDPRAQLSNIADSGQTRERTHVSFTKDAKNMTVGLWESGAADYGMLISTGSKFVRVPEGKGTSLEHDSKVQYVAAITIFHPKGHRMPLENPELYEDNLCSDPRWIKRS